MRSLARTDLQSAISTSEIIPFYQPIVDIDSGQPKGFEVLARWDSAAYGRVVPPDEFIQFAEEVGLLESLTESIFSQAVQTAADWPEHLTLWLNIAPCQMSERGLVERLFHIAVTAAFNLENLVVEVTEGTCLLSEIKARRTADEMQSLGIQLAIDDFGVGYSNLDRLGSLPFNILKVDSTYIAAISKRDSARRKVQSMLRAALALGLDTVAEGIEDEADAEVVRDLGIKKGQGWLFGRPERCPRILSESVV